MERSILSEIFEEQPVVDTSYNSVKKAHACGCQNCKQQQEGEVPIQKSNGQSLIAKGVDTIKDYINRGILSLKIISDFSKGIIYDERLIVDRIFSSRYPKGTINAQKIKEEIKTKIARPYFANLHTTLPDKNPPCTQGFVTNLKSKAINKANTKGGMTFHNKNTHLSPRKTTIDAIVLHHMAFSRGNNLDKYLEVGVHYIVLPDGKVGQLYDDKDHLNASDSFNGRSIAIEFAGNFPYGNFNWWNPRPTPANPNPVHFKSYLTPAQALAGRCLIEHIKKNNPSIQYILAHRQACGPDRPYCPGHDVWLAVGEWGIRNLGLSDKNNSGNPIIGQCYGSCKTKKCPGLPIPQDWRKARP